MKIVFAASEAAPFIKTGGLGDVARALPLALGAAEKSEVTLFLPYYKKIKNDPSVSCEKVCEFVTSLSWREQYTGLFRLASEDGAVRVFFIDNEYYFGRDGIYGFADDGERFAFFSKAILESLVRIGYVPDVIHCNDWQTALVPVLLHAFYNSSLGSAKTVFTIHNIEYQGWAHPYFLGEVLGLNAGYDSTFKLGESINFMKAAILTCDALTTVSRTYAREITDPYFAHGLDEVIRAHAFKLSGIVNGIDPSDEDPLTDPYLSVNYGVKNFVSGKARCKEALFEELGLSDPSKPLIGMVSRLVEHKGMDLVCAAAEELMHWDVRLAILGTGDFKYESALYDVASRHQDRFSLSLRFSKELASRIYAASDIYLMPSKSEPCGLSQLIAMRYGAIPAVHETGGLTDTVAPFILSTGEGLGFTFKTFDKEDMLGALRRALELRGTDTKLWHKAARNCMKRDSSWFGPAGEYMSLYKKLAENH
ncbi:MAG: glycogen synthase [Clostridia bacterium]|nr:glycogen synthase [Clostridia bacterium]